MTRSNRSAVWLTLLATALLAVAGFDLPGLATASAAQPSVFDATKHWSGKTITLVVPWVPGTGMDNWARRMAPYLKKTIPGNPDITIVNKPGAGAVVGLNYFWQASQPDGMWLLVDAGPALKQALSRISKATIKLQELPAIGAFASTQVVHSFKGHVATVQDVHRREKPIYLALRGSGSPASMSILSEIFGLGARAVKGVVYPGGSAKTRTALFSGEVDIYNEGVDTFDKIVRPEIAKGTLAALWQTGLFIDGKFVRNPQAPDIPTYDEVYRQLTGGPMQGELLEASQFNSKLLATQVNWITGRGTPPMIVKGLRDAWLQAANDPEFKKVSVIHGEPIPIVNGEVANQINLELATMPQRLVDRHFKLWKESGLD